MKIPIAPHLATQLLKQIVPQYSEFISELRADPEILTRIVLFAQKSGLSGYPQLYLDKQNINKLALLTLLSVEQINNLGAYIRTLNHEEQIAFANKSVQNLVQSPEKLDSILDPQIPLNPDEVDPSQMTDQEKMTCTAFLVLIHDTISFLVHGQKIVDLIQSALKGDDEAFCLAVQTDKLVLSLPYFKERFNKAIKLETDQDAKFIYNLFYRMQNPVLRGQIKQPKVWIALLLLDSMALLDGTLTRSELLAMLDEAGIEGVGSEDNLSRMLRRFRAYQGDA